MGEMLDMRGWACTWNCSGPTPTSSSSRLWRPYVFADEWDVAAPQEAVFDAISDGRTYPEWWRPVYIVRGRGVWTLTPSAVGTHVRFDWEVHADRRLLKVLTPVLRPLFRWNHAWAIARAVEGLEPYAQRMSARERVGA